MKCTVEVTIFPKHVPPSVTDDALEGLDVTETVELTMDPILVRRLPIHAAIKAEVEAWVKVSRPNHIVLDERFVRMEA